MKGKDIIVTGLQDFDIAIGSNCVNLTKEFAKDNRVLYLNYPVDRLSLIRHKHHPLVDKRVKVIKNERPGLVQIHENLWSYTPKTIIESIAQIGNKSIFDFFNKRNNKKFAKETKQIIDQLGFKDVVVFNDSDIYRTLFFKEILEPDLYIYYTRDNLIHTDYYKKHGARIESQHMAKADLIVANSLYLADYGSQHNPNSHYVGQGCDIDLFDSSKVKAIPEDLKQIKPPVIGYIGALRTLRLDINIIKELALANSDWSIVLIGPEDDEFKKSELHQLRNVYFLGSKNINELPSYLQGFDVAINPQKINEVTIGNYPRKIDEYLAMGKPTIGTRTRAMEAFKGIVYLAKNAEEYVSHSIHALENESEERIQERKNFARNHTWENNVNEIYKAIKNTINK
ncbi:MAG: glycosyltransferase [Bacteroidales bacterium]|nr:glycosyltransferase [Bacteroidales bacterium]